MKIQIEKSIKGSNFADNIVHALRSTPAGLRKYVDAEITRNGDEAEISLFTKDGKPPVRWFINAIIASLSREGVHTNGYAVGESTLDISVWFYNAFEDIDGKVADEAH